MEVGKQEALTEVMVGDTGGVPPPPLPPPQPERNPVPIRRQMARRILGEHCVRLWLARRCLKEDRSSTALFAT
jgi:hypothetical protein